VNRFLLRVLRPGSALLVFAALSVMLFHQDTSAQTRYSYARGQSISPAYEGWWPNDDGSFTMFFGYMNSNWEEEFDVPVGPDNHIDPGGPDQGQPTHFYPRRNMFLFTIRVPKDFGDKELVWTLVTHTKTERAFASLKPDYLLNKQTIATEVGANMSGLGDELLTNDFPVLTVEGGGQRSVRVGAPLSLVAQTAHVGADFGRDGLLVEQVVRFERGVRSFGLPMRDERPREFLVAEVLRDANRKQEHVAARVEMRRLPLIGPAGIDVVVRTDGQIEFFLPVRVHVPEEHREGAVVVLPPALVRRRDALPAGVRVLRLGAGLLMEQKNRDRGNYDQRRSRPQHPTEKSFHDALVSGWPSMRSPAPRHPCREDSRSRNRFSSASASGRGRSFPFRTVLR